MTVTPSVALTAASQPVSTLPEGTRLRDILNTLPKECFQKDVRRAWFRLVCSVVAVALGYVGLVVSPWYLLPLLWLFTGTALTGWFVVGHDCGHRSFAKQRWLNDWVGHLMFLPLLYPFHCWRLGHDQHHAHTNKMDVDNAWQPLRPDLYAKLPAGLQVGYQSLRGRLWWLGSIIHWAGVHFNPAEFAPKDRNSVRLSIGVVLVAGLVGLPLLVATTGLWGLVKFWLMPWLVYHFWMSTFTLVHHTAPQIPFQEAANWDAAQAQLSGTVHCAYPRWVEWLCHDINVHVPHHISTAIPSYNLQLAHRHLQQNWGPYLQETQFSWQLMQQITDRCHLYEPSNYYQSFKEFEVSR
ncbi:fatty acid desaturase [Leptolyngbya sp. FACHB-261]|uniref:fatty acid desaturase n=1 Tax=Leptolyngbya sp. FACHB-261 TaxID=2692806 RepID=UPI0016844CA0|nr:fatty acid desaturase [Leptolyngbya sp. FACHB-261]MBD2100485.1 fatty acid desaturase [Leptolyngbya sp. FACHB-261]